MRKKLFISILLLCALTFVFAQEETETEKDIEDIEQYTVGAEPEEKPFDERILPIQVGPLDVGGAFRFNYNYRSWDADAGGLRDEHGEYDFDTFRVNIDFDEDPWLGSFEYRYYNYRGSDLHFTHFLHHGWIGYRFDDTEQIQAGVHRVPFGILPYASHNWFFALPYYVGLEDDYDLGFKYIKDTDEWNFQAAYYISDEGTYYGESKDSARYSYDVVETSTLSGGSGNEERNQFNIRIAKKIEHNKDWTSELGVSTQYGLIPNEDTDDTGTHYALGAHLNSDYGPWNLMLEAIRYEYNLENPAGQPGNIVTMGAYDFPYKVANRANMFVAGLARDIKVDWGPIKEITIYNDYSILVKDESDFSDSQQNITGFSFALNRWFVYVDYAIGKNHPYFGPAFNDGLASGGASEWETRFNINVGYYF